MGEGDSENALAYWLIAVIKSFISQVPEDEQKNGANFIKLVLFNTK